MYAIIKIGHGQYNVSEGDEIKVNNLNLKEGRDLTVKEVLLLKDGKKTLVGTPFIQDATVSCKILTNYKGRKIISFKFKKRKHQKRKIGFRPILTRLKVEKINLKEKKETSE